MSILYSDRVTIVHCIIKPQLCAAHMNIAALALCMAHTCSNLSINNAT